MTREEIKRWFDEVFCSRYDVSLKNKGGMIEDWADTLKIFDYQTATEAVKELYAESTHKPSINEFKRIAFGVARKSNIQTGNKLDLVRTKVYVQLIGRSRDLRLNRLGKFEEVCYMNNLGVTEQEVFNAAERLKQKLTNTYGGQWAVIDCSGEQNSRSVMRERQKQLYDIKL